jgi:hypothetical protein
VGQGAETAKGAAGGAIAGASIGSIVPGYGTAIGAGLGALAGGAAAYFSYEGGDSYEEQLKKLSAGYGNRSAPQMGSASQAQNSGFRSNQAGLIAQLEAMARGEGPSAATLQMREAMDRAAGAQASGAAGAGGRGVNAGAAYRNAANNTAAYQAQSARDTGLMRVNEQMGAIGQLGQTVAQGRAADEATSQFNAGANNQVGMANLQAKLSAMGINTPAQMQALMAAMGAQGPSVGTQIMAGGAMAAPYLNQYAQQYKASQPVQTAQAPAPQAQPVRYNASPVPVSPDGIPYY